MRILLLLLILGIQTLKAQNTDYQALLIPSSLTDGANSVVRHEHTKIDIPNIKELNTSYRKVVTILNKKGNSDAGVYTYYDNSEKIRKISANVYDKMGNKVKSFKKSDFIDVSAVSGFSLYEDSRILYLEYTPIDYPYTIEFSYESTSDNTAYIPFWYPVNDYRVSTQKNVFEVQYAPDVGLLEKQLNFEGYDIKVDHGDGYVRYEAENIGAIAQEELAPALRLWAPRLMVSPKKFYYEGYMGSNGEWNALGKWMYVNLLRERDELPEATVRKIQYMVKGIEDPIEKAKIIYDYVQKNTRYISIQEGIGGIQPISAKDVDGVKYGDCKGLTNYTKALLGAVGVPSNYVRVYAGPEYHADIDEDFPSFLGQSNHVILNIPQEGKDPIWLECTSQTMPFGFLGDFTDNRNVFEVSANGGRIIKTPSYSDGQNKKMVNAHYELSSSGILTGEVKRTSMGIDYDNIYSIEKEKKEDQHSYYKREWGHINGLEIESVQYGNDRGKVQFFEEIKVKADNYANKSGNRFFVAPNAFAQNTFVPKRYRERKLPFEIVRGFEEEATLNMTLPDGFDIEAMPRPVTMESEFGLYEVAYDMPDEKHITVRRRLLVKKGKYPKERYNEYRKFRQEVVKSDQAKLVLVRI
ncbi:MAG: DUF3857 domain-containing protein [Flavobacteriaceae bacterium]